MIANNTYKLSVEEYNNGIQCKMQIERNFKWLGQVIDTHIIDRF